MARETEKLLMARADAAKAAFAAIVAARDANIAREILERALSDLTVLTEGVETLNCALAAQGDLAGEVAELKRRVTALEKPVKSSKKK
jgi:hypothetical protein